MMVESTDDPPVYTSQDFTAVNDYVVYLAHRHQALRDNWRANTFGTYLKWTSVFILSVGIIAFLILFGLSLFRAKPEPIIIEPIVVDKPITLIFPEGDADDKSVTSSEIEEGIHVIRKIVTSVEEDRKRLEEATANPSKMVVNFVIFKEIEFGRSGLADVVVGMEYKDSNSDKPSEQWCYVTKNNLSGSSTRIELAKKNGERRIDRDLSVREAKEVRVTLTVLKSAQKFCFFE